MTDPSRDPIPGADYEADTGIPRWVKLTGIVMAVVALLIVAMVLIGGGGGHGPSRHQPSGGDADPPSSDGSVTEGHVPPPGGHG